MPQPDTNPLISVVTAFGRPEYDYLTQAGRSLIPLRELLGERGLQWVISLDGDVDKRRTEKALAGLDIPVTITKNAYAARGPGPARTSALAECGGRWVYTLDADDFAYPEGIMLLIQEADKHKVQWAAGRAVDVVDGVTQSWTAPDPFPVGVVACGAFFEFKIRTGAIPFLLNGTVVRRDLLTSVGGWPVIPMQRSEDTALWSVLTSREPGVWVPVTALGYRKHPASMTHADGFRQIPENLNLIRHMIAVGSTQVGLQDPVAET